jgi:hypothetical protein
MGVRRGFHAQYRTDIVHEIAMARRLHEAAVMRWGIIKLSRVLRTDPAAAMAKMVYCRVQTAGDAPWSCAAGVPHAPQTRATNESILTPSHREWGEFHERLAAHLVCPDFDDYFGPADESDYWPLCSAQLVAELGFAVAETLAVFRCFVGDSDRSIAEHVESMWRKTRPSKIRPAFDAGWYVSPD